MNNTALGAVSNKKENIRFISEAHEKFYYEKLKEVRYVDVYHKALCYCLGISDDNSNYDNAEDLYHHLLDKWKFCWIVDKAKVNGTEEFEDYEPSLTKEQRTERDKALAHFEEAFRQIQ